MVQRMSLADMETGESGKVSEVLGGRGVTDRLQALGVRAGSTITKTGVVSSRGPVVARVGSTQVSVGFGISYKILVEVDR